MGYINLDRLEKVKPPKQTKTSEESYNKYEQKQKADNQIMPFDIYERHGKLWVIIDERGKDNYPIKISIGVDEFGKVLPEAEFIEAISTFAVSDNTKVLIRFQPQPYRDYVGRPYRPLIRGLCYVHPTKDSGLGDGKAVRELQVAINDTFNVSNDRVMLATMPTFKVKKYAADTYSAGYYFAPGHGMEVENADDITEFQFRDNMQGALSQLMMLTGQMDKAMAVYPTTMGALPDMASTTATAVAGADSRTNARSNYKSLTFENTLLTELYWQILQMTNQFAEPETGQKLMGDKVQNFDASADYFYTPLSEAIETEYSRSNQIKELTTLISFIAPSVQIDPQMFLILKYMVAKIFKLMGDEHGDIVAQLMTKNAGQGGKQIANQPNATSNQNAVPMGGMEANTREMAGMA